MNSYKIIFPYQSDRIHLAPNEYDAFDRCYEEIRKSGKRPKIFVVLNLNSNTPYYLEMNGSDREPIEEHVINKDKRDEVSDVLSVNPDEPIAPFQGSTEKTDQFDNPMRHAQSVGLTENQNPVNQYVPSTGEIQNLQNRLSSSEQRVELMGRRINLLEEELIRTKMKVDYIAQLNVGETNMNNLIKTSRAESEKDEGCIIM